MLEKKKIKFLKESYKRKKKVNFKIFLVNDIKYVI
jgi:hypothetical protein